MPTFNEVIEMEIYDSFQNEKNIVEIDNEIINQLINENEENHENIIDDILNENNNLPLNETEWILFYELLEDDIKNIFQVFIDMGFEIIQIFQVFTLIPRLSLRTFQNQLIVDPNILTEILLSNRLPEINLTIEFWKHFKPDLYEIVIGSRENQKNKLYCF